MPNQPSPKQTIHLDLLKPQSNPEKLPTKLLRWLLAPGRYILIVVEAIVLIAFGARFKLDYDLSRTNEAIEQRIPYIESLKSTEILIRKTQFRLATMDTFYKTYPDFPNIIRQIATQTPEGVRLVSANIERNAAQAEIHLSAEATSNSDLATFYNGLRSEPIFSNVNTTGIAFDNNVLTFFLTASANFATEGSQ